MVACVTDGLVRDVDGIDAVGTPVFARGVSPNSPFKDGPGEIGLAVVVGGAAIESGDVIVGDKNGVAVVPRARVADRLHLRPDLAKARLFDAASHNALG